MVVRVMPVVATVIRCAEAFMCADAAFYSRQHEWLKMAGCIAFALFLGFCLWEVYRHLKPHEKKVTLQVSGKSEDCRLQ